MPAGSDRMNLSQRPRTGGHQSDLFFNLWHSCSPRRQERTLPFVFLNAAVLLHFSFSPLLHVLVPLYRRLLSLSLSTTPGAVPSPTLFFLLGVKMTHSAVSTLQITLPTQVCYIILECKCLDRYAFLLSPRWNNACKRPWNILYEKERKGCNDVVPYMWWWPQILVESTYIMESKGKKSWQLLSVCTYMYLAAIYKCVHAAEGAPLEVQREWSR